MAAPEHERAGPVERCEQVDAVRLGGHAQEGKAHEQRCEQRQRDRRQPPADREAKVEAKWLHVATEQHRPHEPRGEDRQRLPDGAGDEQSHGRRPRGKREPGRAARQRAGHGDHGGEDDSGSGELEPVQPAGACHVRGADDERERGEHGGRR